MTTSEVATVFELGTEAEKEVSAARAKLTEAIATARAAEAKIRTSIEPIRSFVQHSFGDRSPVAASFGFEPRRTPYVSAEVRYEAIEKLRATRAMRAATRLAGQAN